MNEHLKLLKAIAAGSLLLVGGCFVVALLFGADIGNVDQPSQLEKLLRLFAIAIPAVISGYCIFRMLLPSLTRREARAAAMGFVVLSPVTVGLGMLAGEIGGGYSELLLGSRLALFGAALGVYLVTTALSFALSVFIVRTSRMKNPALSPKPGD